MLQNSYVINVNSQVDAEKHRHLKNKKKICNESISKCGRLEPLKERPPGQIFELISTKNMKIG